MANWREDRMIEFLCLWKESYKLLSLKQMVYIEINQIKEHSEGAVHRSSSK